jgi:hypothetical protein
MATAANPILSQPAFQQSPIQMEKPGIYKPSLPKVNLVEIKFNLKYFFVGLSTTNPTKITDINNGQKYWQHSAIDSFKPIL